MGWLFCPIFPNGPGAAMNYKIGDPVMHWTYGFGKIVGLEERDLFVKTTLYYAVKLHDLTIWVPADEKLNDRLRPPTPAADFKALFKILTSPGDPLPEDRHERKLHLVERLKDGRAESMCRVLRDLLSFQQIKSLNENDQYYLKRVQASLLGEWGFSFSIPPTQAATDLNSLLNPHLSAD
jgi:RNA polymerase-interacting CarD/CdnL/TRCF family regulator